VRAAPAARAVGFYPICGDAIPAPNTFFVERERAVRDVAMFVEFSKVFGMVIYLIITQYVIITGREK
jgi:hypothetical protein